MLLLNNFCYARSSSSCARWCAEASGRGPGLHLVAIQSPAAVAVRAAYDYTITDHHTPYIQLHTTPHNTSAELTSKNNTL